MEEEEGHKLKRQNFACDSKWRPISRCPMSDEQYIYKIYLKQTPKIRAVSEVKAK